MAACPAHPDDKASLSLTETADGKVLVHCFAGCETEAIVQAVGLELKDLFPDDSNSNGNSREPVRYRSVGKRERLVSEYIYEDSSGTPKLKVLRYQPKTFKQQQWNGREWSWAGEKPKLLYQLPKLAKAEQVFIVEGEQDADNLEKLGLTATTSPGGADKWKSEYSDAFNKDQQLILLPDNDPPGHRHAEKIATSLYDRVASLKVLQLPDLPDKGDVTDWLKGKEPESAKKELLSLIDKTADWAPQRPSAILGWELYDIADIPTVEVQPLSWVVEPLIPSNGIGFLAGAPKVSKSLLTLDLVVHIAQVKDWIGMYKTRPIRTLYISREDPLRRLQERLVEINDGYGFGKLPSDAIQFLVRERFSLLDQMHIDWVAEQVQTHGFEFLILDVFNRMIPGLNQNDAQDMAAMVNILEDLNRELGLTILILDHTRKPVGLHSAKDKQTPNPFDLLGSVLKYGCADYMLCLNRTNQQGRLQLLCENKDTDENPHFLIDVSPKGSGQSKFTYAGDIEQLSNDMKELGTANREKVFEALSESWVSPAEVVSVVNLSSSTVRGHLKRLEDEGRAQKQGGGQQTKWRKAIAEVVQGNFSDGNATNEE